MTGSSGASTTRSARAEGRTRAAGLRRCTATGRRASRRTPPSIARSTGRTCSPRRRGSSSVFLRRSSSRPARSLALRSAERWTRRLVGPASSRGRSSEARWGGGGRAVRRRPALRARAIDGGGRHPRPARRRLSALTGSERVASASVRMPQPNSRGFCSIARSSTTIASREGRTRAAARSRCRAGARAGIVAEFARSERRALETFFRGSGATHTILRARSATSSSERSPASFAVSIPVPGEEPTPGNLPHGPGDGFRRTGLHGGRRRDFTFPPWTARSSSSRVHRCRGSPALPHAPRAQARARREGG